MPIRYSQGPIAYTTIRADTSAHLRADLDAVLLACNWVHVGPVTNGWVYLITSPEGLSCRVLVQDQGVNVPLAGSCISIQFQTSDGAEVGFRHDIIYGTAFAASRSYEVVVNRCQLFMALVGWSTGVPPNQFDSYLFSVAGGIPALPPDSDAGCQTAAQPTIRQINQMFWSCGTEFFPFDVDFRNCRFCSQSFSWCLNDTVFIQTGGSGDRSSGLLSLFPLTQTDNIDLWYATPPQVLKYKTDASGKQVDGDPLYIDALVGWQHQIRGQVWDAFQVTRDEPLDSIQTLTDFDASGNPFTITAVAWNRDPTGKGGAGTYFCTLYLLTAPITPKIQTANVHY